MTKEEYLQRKASPLLRAHDVRSLAVCADCGELGAGTADLADRTGLGLTLEIDGRSRHPKHVGIDALRALPTESRNQIRLCDIGVDTMAALLAGG